MAYSRRAQDHNAAMPRADDAPAPDRPYVREELGSLSLHFSDAAIQSRMDLLRPDALVLEYTRTMMGFLMFAPEPAHIAIIGLGGGSLVRFCHRHLPRTRVTAIELNPHVIALRERFGVPPDGARLRVVQADGAHHVATTAERYDALLVDAFDTAGMPEALATRRFYDDCVDTLRPGGMLVANLHASHPLLDVHLDRLRGAVAGPVLRVDDRDGSNSVVFARRGEPLRAHRRVAPVAAELHDAWSRIAHALQRVGATDGQ